MLYARITLSDKNAGHSITFYGPQDQAERMAREVLPTDISWNFLARKGFIPVSEYFFFLPDTVIHIPYRAQVRSLDPVIKGQ